MTSQIHRFLTVYGKIFGLLAAMALGATFPGAHRLSLLIQYLLMVMLFFAFLDIKFKPQTFQASVLWILLANLSVAFLSYGLLVSVDRIYALTAFMTAIASAFAIVVSSCLAAVSVLGWFSGCGLANMK